MRGGSTDRRGPVLRRPSASAYLGLSQRTLEKYDREGRGPSKIKLGRAVGYLPADLDAWLEARRVEVARDLRKGGRAGRAPEGAR